MKISHVATCVNDNPKYFNLIELFSKAWRSVLPHIKIAILYLESSEKNLEILEKNCDYVIQLKNLSFADSIAFSKLGPLYFPALIDTEQFVVTCNINTLPLCPSYLLAAIPKFNSRSFIALKGDKISTPQSLSLDYCIAMN